LGGRLSEIRTQSGQIKITVELRALKLSANWEECGPCPVFASYTLAFAIQLRKNHKKTSARVAEEFRSLKISYYKGKAVPLQAGSGPEGSMKLKFLDFMTTAQDGGKVVSLTHWPPLPPGNTPGTYFC
jgi:hypothetical protein